jgi:hypothetical protein
MGAAFSETHEVSASGSSKNPHATSGGFILREIRAIGGSLLFFALALRISEAC